MSKPASRMLAALALAVGLVAPIAQPAAARAPNEHAIYVWKIVAPDAQQDAVDYLVGTLRAPVPAGQVMPSKLRAILSHATTLVTEVPNTQVAAAESAAYMKMPTNRPLSAYMKPATWQKLVKAVKPFGMGPEVAAQLAPWPLTMMVQAAPSAKAEPSMDDRLREHALRAKVGLDFLESPEEQLRLMSEVSLREQVAQLIDAVESPQRIQQLNARAKAAYASGDLARVEAEVVPESELKRYPDYFAKMLHGRTSDWVQRVDELCQDEDAVVAVGIAHLLGKQGLIKALKDRGYYIQAIEL